MNVTRFNNNPQSWSHHTIYPSSSPGLALWYLRDVDIETSAFTAPPARDSQKALFISSYTPPLLHAARSAFVVLNSETVPLMLNATPTPVILLISQTSPFPLFPFFSRSPLFFATSGADGVNPLVTSVPLPLGEHHDPEGYRLSGERGSGPRGAEISPFSILSSLSAGRLSSRTSRSLPPIMQADSATRPASSG